jgi:heme/copper-type cytochrome/quinol oxidase subunit 3
MPVAARHSQGLSRSALQFFALSAGLLCGAGLLAWGLMHWCGRNTAQQGLHFPPAFAVSTLLLALGSFSLQQALRAVQRERQGEFRGWLRAAVAAGGLFMGVQSYGLWTLLPRHRSPEEAALGVTGFVLAFAALHALHFLVAVLFVCFIAVRTQSDRYDHEYYWGVTVCAWFWHALGIAWGAILIVFAIALW